MIIIRNEGSTTIPILFPTYSPDGMATELTWQVLIEGS